MKKLASFKNFRLNESDGDPRYTEDEIAEILENFDGSRFFKVNIEKTRVEFFYPAKVEERED